MLTLEDLKKELRARPAEERDERAEMLLASLDDAQEADVEAAWAKEIAARIGAYERGEAEVFAAEGVFCGSTQAREMMVALPCTFLE